MPEPGRRARDATPQPHIRQNGQVIAQISEDKNFEEKFGRRI
jgi:hypothetical protein